MSYGEKTMRLAITFLILVSSWHIPALTCWADETPKIPVNGTAPKELQVFDDMMRDFVAKHKVPGAAVAIVKDGRLVYARGFGYADKEKGSALLPTHLFRIASISKPVTALAIMRLVEQKRLRLTDKVVDLLDIAPASAEGKKRDQRWRQITVDHLLHHTGGWDRTVSFDPMFRSVKFAEELKRPAPATAQDVIDYMVDQPLDFNPGEKYAYSNFGYCILGRIIEKVTKQPYEDYVKKEILAPVGIKDMRIGKTKLEGKSPNEVNYYSSIPLKGPNVFTKEKEKYVPLPYGAWYLEAMDSHGGWIASAVDLVRIGSALDDDASKRILKRKTVDQLFERLPDQPGLDKDDKKKDVYYGRGWLVRQVDNGSNRNTWHNGALSGTSTILVRRHDGLCWAVLFNADRGEKGVYLSGLIDPLMHQTAAKVEAWPQSDLFPKYLGK